MFDKFSLSKSLLTTILCISFIIGILLGPNFTSLPNISILFILTSTILFYLSRSLLAYFSICLLGLVIGITAIQSHILSIKQYQLLDYDTTHTITGTIAYPPEIKNNKQQIMLTNLFDNDNQPYNGNLLIFASPFPRYQYADQIIVTGKISQPENFVDDFSYIGYLSLRNIYYTAYYPKINLASPLFSKISKDIKNTSDTFNETESDNHNSPPLQGGAKKPEGRSGVVREEAEYRFSEISGWCFQKLYIFRDFILDQINHSLPYPQSGLLAGLLLGYKNALPPDLYEQFRVAGLTHIIVVSGFNLTIFATLFLKNLRGQLPKTILLALTIISILIFTILTGAESSIVRAFFMSIILISAPFLSRKNHHTIAILLAACIMIAINPLILWYDAGFHLSFLATFGLMYISPILSQLKLLKILPEFISSTLSETLSAMIPTTPYIATSFHQISLVALLSNILVLPLIPITMAFGANSIILSFIPPLATPIHTITNTLLSYIIYIGQLCSQIPYSSIEVDITNNQLLIFYIVIFGGIYFLNKFQISNSKIL